MIAIVDDRKEVRELLKEKIELILVELGSELPIFDIEPFIEMKHYSKWIIDNEISVLLIDENLQEQSGEKGIFADYNGHKLVSELRKSFKDLPIFIIAAIVEDTDLTTNFSNYEGVIQRDEFYDNSEQFVHKFVRSAQRYVKFHYADLHKLSELSELIATNKASKDDYDLLKTLQTKLNLPYDAEIIHNRQSWLKELEDKTYELEALTTEIKSYMES